MELNVVKTSGEIDGSVTLETLDGVQFVAYSSDITKWKEYIGMQLDISLEFKDGDDDYHIPHPAHKELPTRMTTSKLRVIGSTRGIGQEISVVKFEGTALDNMTIEGPITVECDDEFGIQSGKSYTFTGTLHAWLP